MSPARHRLGMLESEIRALRPRPGPSESTVPLTGDRGNRAALILSEMSHYHLSLSERDAARRAIADAIVVLENVTDEATLARCNVLLGEALLFIDQPQHAFTRLGRAVATYERFGDKRWCARARLALGKTMVALDDSLAVDVLVTARGAYAELGETATVAKIDLAIRDAEKIFDTPRSVCTGYGRPVTIFPPPSDG